MWRIFLLLSLFLLLAPSQLEGKAKIDSLRIQLNQMPDDTSKVDAMLQIIDYFRMRNMEDSLRHYAAKAIQLSTDLKYYQGAIKSIQSEALIEHALGNFDEAKKKYHQALAIAKESNRSEQFGSIYNNMGTSYNRAGQYDSSFYYYTLAEQAYKKNDQLEDIWRVYNGIALLYINRDEIEKSGIYLDKTYEAIKDSDNRMHKGFVIYKAAEFFFHTDNYNKYLKYAEHWATLQNEKKGTKDLIDSPEHAALSFLFSDDDDATIRRLENAAKHFEDLGNQKRYAWILEDLARVYYKNKQTEKAINLAEQAKKIFQSLDEKLRLVQTQWFLYRMYDEQNNYGEALKNYRSASTTIDSFQSKEREKTFADLEVRYDTDKKEQALKIQELEIKQKTQQRNVLLLSSLLLALLAGLIFVGFRQRLKTNKELAAQRSEIQSQKIQQLEQEKQLLAFSSMIEGQESERIRIAKDLHDGIGGLLTTAKAHFNAIQDQVKKLEELNLVHKTNELIDEACVEVRRISQNMMPRALMLYGLNGAIEDLATNLKQNKINCNLEIIGLEKEPEKTKAVMIFRILQELSNNILKHAQAKNVLIQLLEADNGLSVIVEDDGIGFKYEEAIQKKSLGLSSIESRVKYLQGNLDYDSVSGEGTTIAIWIPLD